MASNGSYINITQRQSVSLAIVLNRLPSSLDELARDLGKDEAIRIDQLRDRINARLEKDGADGPVHADANATEPGGE
jgi:hypothetical protein